MSRAAIRYAKAILDIAVTSGTASQVNDDMKNIAETISGNQELRDFLSSPVISGTTKINVLKEVFSSVQNDTNSLFRLLQENKRFEILGDIASKFNGLYDEMQGIEKATVITAIPLDDAMEMKVLATIATITTKKVDLQNIIDPDIIGGFILRIGDKQYNASVASRLLELKLEISN